MTEREKLPLQELDEDAALRSILEGTASETGEGFLDALVASLGESLGTSMCWTTEYLPEQKVLRPLAVWTRDLPREVMTEDYPYAGTPCEPVVESREIVHIPRDIVELYPGDNDLDPLGAVSYLGAPLLDADGEKVLGHLAVMDSRPMPAEPRGQAIFRIFAARAAAELRRWRAEARLREREESLAGLLNAARDAILDLDEDLGIRGLNPAAGRTFRCEGSSLEGRSFPDLLDEPSRARFLEVVEKLREQQEEGSLWVPGVLTARDARGGTFPVEASLSRYHAGGRTRLTVFLHDVNDRLEAERRLRRLTAEAEALRGELRSHREYEEILGESEPILRLLAELDRVAGTEATVLVTGETGTGKELVARALHRASRRREGPFVCVNCAALPENLVESELFGHAAGAFTGASQRREGRFALADGGTIFLDEIGELPLELQPKLLRVLQEGTFEAVGSSQTIEVDVRVVAATNRDLAAEVKAGRFREDLYFRLAVVPLEVPPLRERGEDVVLLAERFLEEFARRHGLPAVGLEPQERTRLLAYDWPGNVRELRNVLERAVITSQEGRLALGRFLPASIEALPTPAADGGRPPEEAPILTDAEMRELERRNIERALEASGGKVSGPGGAAELLGLKPSTLSSRIKAFGIERDGS